MRREDWRDVEYERQRRGAGRDREDFGQADYSDLYGYDPPTRSGYRAYDDGREHEDERARREGGWVDEPERRRMGARESEWDYGPEHRPSRRRGSSDRVLWAVIMERLEDERRLDLRDVDVEVRDGEVTLNGTVRRKEDKRRIEDVADIEGVRNVQNNLRVRDRDRPWSIF